MQSVKALCLVLMLALGGCITETTGGLPPPLPDEERVRANLDLARGYLGKRDWIRARSPLDRALEIDPNSVETHVLLGVLFEGQGDPALAEGCVEGNCQNGRGTREWQSGDRYTGDFVAGKRTGKGLYTWADGVTYEGDFVDG